jgi:hypothetical protein
MRRILLVVAVLCIAFAPAPFPKPVSWDGNKKDLKKMQGKWLFPMPDLLRTEYRVVSIKDDLLSFVSVNPPQVWRMRFPRGGKPNRIDLHLVSPGANPPFSSVLRGIYRIDGDKLAIGFSFSPDEKDRPVDFDKVHPSLLLQLSNRTEH